MSRRRVGGATRFLSTVSVFLCAVAGAAAGTPQLKVYFPSDFKDQAYRQKAYTKVASAWKRPAGVPDEGHKAVVIVTIQRDGKAAKPRLHMQSGSEAWDQAAVEAVGAAAPFDPLPKAYKGASAEVHFHFEYNAK